MSKPRTARKSSKHVETLSALKACEVQAKEVPSNSELVTNMIAELAYNLEALESEQWRLYDRLLPVLVPDQAAHTTVAGCPEGKQDVRKLHEQLQDLLQIVLRMRANRDNVSYRLTLPAGPCATTGA